MRLFYLSLFSSFFGILLVYYSVPAGYPHKTVDRAVLECDGRAEVHGTIVKEFVSRKGSRIAVMQGDEGSLLAVVKRFRGKGPASIRGRLSEYSGECWLFEE